MTTLERLILTFHFIKHAKKFGDSMNKNMRKNFKVFALILLTSALLLVAIIPNVPSVKAATTDSVLAYTSLGGSMAVNGTTLAGGGTTTTYAANSDLNFTATASSGFNFLCWEYASTSGPSTSTSNPFSYVISVSEVAIIAMFTPTTNVTQSSTSTGTATVDVFNAIGGTTSPAGGFTGPAYSTYTIGTTYSFTQTPGSGFEFFYWIIDTSAGATVYTSSTLSLKLTSSSTAIQAFWIPTGSTLTLPTIISEFSSAMIAVLLSVLILIATGTYVYIRRAKK